MTPDVVNLEGRCAQLLLSILISNCLREATNQRTGAMSWE